MAALRLRRLPVALAVLATFVVATVVGVPLFGIPGVVAILALFYACEGIVRSVRGD